ncbi:MAG: puuC, partial [Steroidobacteraceae bacterium]|nr:puuC [Steroidobacteraceae bacterium]
ADIDRAVASARAAFRKANWADMPPKARKKVLLRLADLMLQHREELALLETLDMGKPIGDSMSVDIPSAANCIRWYGEAVDKIYDEVAPTGPNALATITREPMGVVGAIVPWNFPLLMASWKIGPVLASGNSLVLKPSEKSPLTALRVAELAVEAGLPPGVCCASRSWPWKRACRPACSTWCRASATPQARRWPRTWTWIASRSPVPRRRARQ